MKRFCALALCVAMLAATAFCCGGCKKKGRSRDGLVKASGVVLYNGTPVDGATVMFYPAEMGGGAAPAVARTDEKGEFVLTTDETGDGALPGSYKVTIDKHTDYVDGIPRLEWEKQNAGELGAPPEVDRDAIESRYDIPEKYTVLATSGLTQTIPAEGTKEIKFELTD